MLQAKLRRKGQMLKTFLSQKHDMNQASLTLTLVKVNEKKYYALESCVEGKINQRAKLSFMKKRPCF